MTRDGAIDAQWAERLAACGLSQPADLLEQTPGAGALCGRWHALAKPGLGGRERWRWELAPAGHAANEGIDSPVTLPTTPHESDSDAAGEVLFVKRYLDTPLRAQLDRIRRQRGRHSRAWWEFSLSKELAQARIGAPRAVAFAEEMDGRMERRSAVVLERVPGEAFDRLWPRLEVQRAPVTLGPLRHELTVRLARFVAAFHSTGLCHRDLYLCHVFAEIDALARVAPRFALIDLARGWRPRLRRMRWIIKDLSQLDVSARALRASRSDRLRFLLAYLGLQRGARRTRWYVRRIVGRSRRVLARQARKAATA